MLPDLSRCWHADARTENVEIARASIQPFCMFFIGRAGSLIANRAMTFHECVVPFSGYSEDSSWVHFAWNPCANSHQLQKYLLYIIVVVSIVTLSCLTVVMVTASAAAVAAAGITTFPLKGAGGRDTSAGY